VHDAGQQYRCVGCQGTTGSLAGWEVCGGCAWAKHLKREPAHLGPPTNVGPLCVDCSSQHGTRQCGHLKPLLEQPTCDILECERAGKVVCDGCSRVLCCRCLDTLHSVSGVVQHPAHVAWPLPSLDADQAAVLGKMCSKALHRA
jgi:hypothetical protein